MVISAYFSYTVVFHLMSGVDQIVLGDSMIGLYWCVHDLCDVCCVVFNLMCAIAC